ncbi:hypothetical protein BU14_0127s0046 [Porphyra umbilicalis]|uniref:Uncharacterized protein n=1 Tax=Porphyra umbilicalis TaxID=2786 RepID=A0A1X6PAL3_PORUM|nr:hypothetical protein BU14_0127s0046 [Porphyra umbilicalis]|eukprot:OSX77949.1 hypothetical protein BU14_0127s0046 [Porphyra umbilicalis]
MRMQTEERGPFFSLLPPVAGGAPPGHCTARRDQCAPGHAARAQSGRCAYPRRRFCAPRARPGNDTQAAFAPPPRLVVATTADRRPLLYPSRPWPSLTAGPVRRPCPRLFALPRTRSAHPPPPHWPRARPARVHHHARRLGGQPRRLGDADLPRRRRRRPRPCGAGRRRRRRDAQPKRLPRRTAVCRAQRLLHLLPAGRALPPGAPHLSPPHAQLRLRVSHFRLQGFGAPVLWQAAAAGG